MVTLPQGMAVAQIVLSNLAGNAKASQPYVPQYAGMALWLVMRCVMLLHLMEVVCLIAQDRNRGSTAKKGSVCLIVEMG